MEKETSIDLAGLRRLRESNRGIIVIDVRSEAEYNEKHIPYAIHLPLERIESGSIDLDLQKIIVTVCGKGGGRSEKAAKHIRENYIAESYFLEGGTFGWFENENRS